MISYLQRLSLSCAALLTVTLSTYLCAEEGKAVVASVTFQNGGPVKYDLPEDAELEIETCVGDLSFDCAHIASIQMSANTALATVTLISGERWRTELGNDALRAIGLRNAEDDTRQYGDVHRIEFAATKTPDCQPTHYMKLLMEDGSQAFITPADLTIPVETEYAKLDVPVGALCALKFLSAEEGYPADIALIRFPNGDVKRLDIRSRFPYFRAQDCYGNRLKVYRRDVMGIINPVELGGESLPTTSRPEQSGTSRVTTRDGRARRVSIPLSVWELRVDLGTIAFPSPIVHSMKRSAHSPDEVELRTVFGDILTGKLLTRELFVHSEVAGGYSEIDFEDIAELITSSPVLPIPDGWLVLYLTSGIAVVGRFEATSTGLVTDRDEILPSRLVYSLTPTPRDTFVAASKGGQVRTCRTGTREASIMLLSTGAGISVPWSDIHLAKIQRKTDEAVLRNAIEQAKKDKAEGARSEAEELRLSTTALGTLRLRPEDIVSVSVDRDSGRACVTTLYGDALLTSVPSSQWFERLQDIENYEFPEEKQFTVTTQPPRRGKVFPNSVVCRLSSGSVLHGTLVGQELNIRESGDRFRTTAVDIQALQGVSRSLDGDLSFSLRTGRTVTGTPKERSLKLKLSATGEEEEIPLKMIESLLVGSKDLPPTTVFRPGLPANLTGEILVEGGAFMQGSDSGMDDERPVHRVSLKRFFMDATEVTRAQFAAFVSDTGYETVAESARSKATWRSPGFMQRQDDPVVCVSWSDAAAYCNWRSKQAGLSLCYAIEEDTPVETDRSAIGYRLPTEAEWEYAARNRGIDYEYPWGDKAAPTSANYEQRGRNASTNWEWTCPVKAFPANPLGIYGLGGNVWEWCEDWYFDRAYFALQNRVLHNPCIGPDTAAQLTRRVMRGGSYRNGLDLLRCTSRGSGLPYAFASHVGFRCVRNAE